MSVKLTKPIPILLREQSWTINIVFFLEQSFNNKNQNDFIKNLEVYNYKKNL